MRDLFTDHLDFGPAEPIEPRSLPAHGGVYLIADADDRPILLASGENLRRVVLNRLAAPPPDARTRRANLAEVGRRIHWRASFSRFETCLIHWRVARSLYPRTYRERLGFGPAWFLRLDARAAHPRFTAATDFGPGGGEILGPFATRKHADEWIHTLEDAFDLCRYHPILEQAPHGEACAYFEMGRCPAPCDGTISMDAYRGQIAEALRFSRGDPEPRLTALQSAMRAAAADRAFEKAASLRQIRDRATALLRRPEYEHVTDLNTAAWLVFQRGGPGRRSPRRILVKPFRVRRGRITEGRPVGLAELPAALPDWIESARRPGQPDAAPDPTADSAPAPAHEPGAATDRQPTAEAALEPTADPAARAEVFWLLSRFLFQGDRAPGLFYRTDRLPPPEQLLAAVVARFAPRPADPRPADPRPADPRPGGECDPQPGPD